MGGRGGGVGGEQVPYLLVHSLQSRSDSMFVHTESEQTTSSLFLTSE